MLGPLRPIRTKASFCPLRPGASPPKKLKATSSPRILHHVASLRLKKSPTTQSRRHSNRPSSLPPTTRHYMATTTVTHVHFIPFVSSFDLTFTRQTLNSSSHHGLISLACILSVFYFLLYMEVCVDLYSHLPVRTGSFSFFISSRDVYLFH
ncbi:hypothetical protein EV702DRAFT_695750 [Suillus placidus]|uniref:Uncharacterized protein n=1 Tax=Suillus placidus TaxID=48579 RepID=A0A9P6ZKH2_9AGAM|nr:hypothetical protein EV702DRAFT_695750 [Suillus placidus]